jgi:hypothetical protein
MSLATKNSQNGENFRQDFDSALGSFFAGRGVVAPAATATGIAEGLNELAKKMGVQTMTAD